MRPEPKNFYVRANLAKAVVSVASGRSIVHIDFPLYNTDETSVVAAAIARSASVARVTFSNGEIGPNSAAILGNALRTAPALEAIAIEGNPLGDSGAAAIVSALEGSGRIVEVSLVRCQVGGVGTRAFVDYFARCAPALRHLDLSENYISRAEARELAEALVHLHALETLNLSKNSVDCDGARALAHALGSLRVLNLDNNLIENEGCIALANALSRSSSMEQLTLDGNRIGDEGCEALLHAIVMGKSLKVLSVKGNCMGSESIRLCSIALRLSSISLSELRLGGMRQPQPQRAPRNDGFEHDEGTLRLAELSFAASLEVNTTLRSLEFQSLDGSDAVGAALAAALARNRTLTSARLELAARDGTLGREFAQMLRSNTALTELAVFSKSPAPLALSELATALLDNTTLRKLVVSQYRVAYSDRLCFQEIFKVNSALDSYTISSQLPVTVVSGTRPNLALSPDTSILLRCPAVTSLPPVESFSDSDDAVADGSSGDEGSVGSTIPGGRRSQCGRDRSSSRRSCGGGSCGSSSLDSGSECDGDSQRRVRTAVEGCMVAAYLTSEPASLRLRVASNRGRDDDLDLLVEEEVTRVERVSPTEVRLTTAWDTLHFDFSVAAPLARIAALLGAEGFSEKDRARITEAGERCAERFAQLMGAALGLRKSRALVSALRCCEDSTCTLIEEYLGHRILEAAAADAAAAQEGL